MNCESALLIFLLYTRKNPLSVSDSEVRYIIIHACAVFLPETLLFRFAMFLLSKTYKFICQLPYHALKVYNT